MEASTFDEIISTLAKCGRPDLIMALKEFENDIVDESYDPSQERFRKREPLSDDEGSSIYEDYAEYEISIDKNGFHSLI